MDNSKSSSTKKKLVLFFMAVFVLMIVLGFYFFLQPILKNSIPEAEYMDNLNILNSARDSISAGDFDTAASEYQKGLDTKMADHMSNYLRISEAYALFFSEEQDKEDRAIHILLEIIDSSDSTDISKAYAINALLDRYARDESRMFLNKILVDQTFKSIKLSTPDEVVFALSKMADELHPTSISKLRMANFYANKLLASTELDTQTAETYRNSILLLLDEAEELIYSEHTGPLTEVDIAQIALYRHYKAYVLAALNKEDSPESIPEIYSSPLELIATHPNNVLVQKTAIRTNFYYAAFLNREDSVSNRDVIDSSIKNIINLSTNDSVASGFRAFLKNKLVDPEAKYGNDYNFIQELRLNSQEFDNFITGLTT